MNDTFPLFYSPKPRNQVWVLKGYAHVRLVSLQNKYLLGQH